MNLQILLVRRTQKHTIFVRTNGVQKSKMNGWFLALISMLHLQSMECFLIHISLVKERTALELVRMTIQQAHQWLWKLRKLWLISKVEEQWFSVFGLVKKVEKEVLIIGQNTMLAKIILM